MNYSHRARLSKLSLGLIVALAAAPAFAQSTSAGVGGQVIGAGGAPVTGAEVTIVHAESGTVNRVTTDANGRYNARGLRVGGPYTITVTKAGEGTRTEDNVYLNLNAVNTVNAALTGDMTTLQTVTATVIAGSDVFSSTKMGTGTNVDNSTIERMPSANRNIQDYMRLDPRVTVTDKVDGSISVGGQNPRYNVIRIDGISSNDPFGLESNNLPTNRQPVSMDAIEEISIDVANYDVTVAGGTGAVVNAVTKSGTNEFGGSVYYTVRDADWVADDLEEKGGKPFTGFSKEETYGFTLGGPIVRDRLFFFANYEQFTRSAPIPNLTASPFGRGEIVDADIEAIQAAARAHGFEAGELTAPAKTDVEEVAVKLDWNISDNHRASLRYSQMEELVPKFPGIANGYISLSTHWYDQKKEFTSVVGELFSDWTENFSTEFKISQRDYDSIAQPYANLPYIQIRGIGPNNAAVRIGTEQNRHVNVVETEQLSLFGAATWHVGDHAIKFGFDRETNDVLNFYGRNLNGVWTFNNVADFAQGNASSYVLRAPRPDGSLADIPAAYEMTNTGFFIQDTWFPTYNLSLLFGLRYDKPSFGDRPVYNPRIEELYGLDNTNTVDDGLFQPRFGFNYTFDSDRPTQLRGGVGLFQGASPNVWLAGAFQNTGLSFVEYDPAAADIPEFTPVLPPQIPGGDANALIVADIMEPGLKLPSTWKANLAFDHELPWYGITASAEVLFTKNKDALWFDRLDVGAPTAVGQDGRAIYWNEAGLDPTNAGRFGIEHDARNGILNRANKPADVNQAIVIRNTDIGSSRQMTLSLFKPLIENWSWSVGYTYTDATEFSPASSSQNSSNWSNSLVFQTNQPVDYNSRYTIKDRFTGTLTWQKELFGNNKTTVAMFYEGRSGRPFSYIFYNDVNGDSATTNDLFYVPNGPGDVLFTGGAAMEAAFFDWLNANPELKSYAGGVAPANAFRASWVNSFDVRVSQEFPGFMQGHKAELSLDIMNIGNLLNKDWGQINDYGFYATRRVANYAGIDPTTGKYVYNFTGSTDNESLQEVNNDGVNTAVSRWSIMLGIKYKF